MNSIVRVGGLGKQYHVGRSEAPYSTLRESLMRAARAPVERIWGLFGGRRATSTSKADDLFWALRGVEFEVHPGEIVGVIGRNGAGKSTLLKILSRVTEPTTGRVELYGRVGSLLEVGTGFHAELTGRENIFLNGSIMGMGRREITRKLDEIIAFAEIERFVDTPVKRYSSGMYMRLAFAVAAHLEPEILVIDEVLAVGDAQFQRKCLGKMNEVSRQGRTVLFVSHNMLAVQALCDRTIWLEAGRIAADGPTSTVARDYLKAASVTVATRTWDTLETAPGNEHIRLHAARLVPPPGVTAETLDLSTPFALEFEYSNLEPEVRLNVSLSMYNNDNICVFESTSLGEGRWDGRPFPAGRFKTTCLVPGKFLNDGGYRVSVLFVRDTTVVVFALGDILEFEVHDDAKGRGDWHGKWHGVVRPELRWDTRTLDEVPPESRLNHKCF